MNDGNVPSPFRADKGERAIDRQRPQEIAVDARHRVDRRKECGCCLVIRVGELVSLAELQPAAEPALVVRPERRGRNQERQAIRRQARDALPNGAPPPSGTAGERPPANAPGDQEADGDDADRKADARPGRQAEADARGRVTDDAGARPASAAATDQEVDRREQKALPAKDRGFIDGGTGKRIGHRRGEPGQQDRRRKRPGWGAGIEPPPQVPQDQRRKEHDAQREAEDEVLVADEGGAGDVFDRGEDQRRDRPPIEVELPVVQHGVVDAGAKLKRSVLNRVPRVGQRQVRRRRPHPQTDLPVQEGVGQTVVMDGVLRPVGHPPGGDDPDVGDDHQGEAQGGDPRRLAPPRERCGHGSLRQRACDRQIRVGRYVRFVRESGEAVVARRPRERAWPDPHGGGPFPLGRAKIDVGHVQLLPQHGAGPRRRREPRGRRRHRHPPSESGRSRGGGSPGSAAMDIGPASSGGPDNQAGDR